MVCDKQLKQITRNHLVRHEMTIADYKQKFAGAPLQDESIILRGERNPFFGREHTNEVKKRLSDHFLGGKNPTAGKKISKLWDDSNSTYRQMMKSDTYREKMRCVAQEYWDSSRSNEHRIQNSESLRACRSNYNEKLAEIKQSETYRQASSERTKLMWSIMTPDDKRKRIEKQVVSMMKNGSVSSVGEDRLYELLCKRYPNTKRFIWFHPTITGSTNLWNVDMYVPDIDTYIQFDGVYWHGLDRPVEEIKNSNTKRNIAIYKKWTIDREQDEWFLKVSKRLVRITDIEFKKDEDACLQRILF